MKSLLRLFIFLCFAGLSAQSLSDYAYVYVPKKFVGFKTNNQYNLNKILSAKLKDRKYTVLNEDRENWPYELQQNPCNVLNAELLDDSNMIKNRVKLEFKDCNGKMIASIPASSSIKEFDKGFQDALLKSITSVPTSQNSGQTFAAVQNTPVSTPQPVKTVEKISEPRKETPIKTLESKPITTVQKPAESNSGNRAEVYSNGSQTFNKVNLGIGNFILTSANSSVPYAIFKESTKKDVYRVQLENGTQTLGYSEGNGFVIEIPNSDGTFRKEILNKK